MADDTPADLGHVRKLAMLADAATSRSLLLRRMAGMDEGAKDLDAECGYPKTDPTAEQYRKEFDRGDIAERVVSIYATESWKVKPYVYETEDDEETDFEKAWEQLVDFPNNVLAWLELADVMAGIGRFGVLLIGLDDGDDLSKPVAGVNQWGSWVEPKDRRDFASSRKSRKREREAAAREGRIKNSGPDKRKLPPDIPKPEQPKPVEGKTEPSDGKDGKTSATTRQLIYLRVLDESMVKVATWVKDQKSPRFGMPETYTVTFADFHDDAPGAGDVPTTDKPVHWTRIIHIADGLSTSVVYGKPRMKTVYNRLLDLHKTAGSSAEMFYRGGFPGLAFEIANDADALVGLTPEEKTALRDEYENYSRSLQRYIAVEGTTVKSLSPQVADPGPNADLQIRLIAATLGCPWRIFLGSEAAQLASEQDTTAWNERVNARQRKWVTPTILRPFVDRLIAAGVLPKPVEDYEVEWDDLNTGSDKEKADVAKVKTEAIAAYANNPGARDIMPPRMFYLHIMGLPSEIIDEIMDAAEEQQGQLEEQEDEIPQEGVPPAGLPPNAAAGSDGPGKPVAVPAGPPPKPQGPAFPARP
jgi:hypothetical protein